MKDAKTKEQCKQGCSTWKIQTQSRVMMPKDVRKWTNETKRGKKGKRTTTRFEKRREEQRRLQCLFVPPLLKQQELQRSSVCSLVNLPAVSQIRSPPLPHQSSESSRTVPLVTHSSSYHPAQGLHQIRGSQVLARSPNHTAMPQVLAHVLCGLRRQTCPRL